MLIGMAIIVNNDDAHHSWRSGISQPSHSYLTALSLELVLQSNGHVELGAVLDVEALQACQVSESFGE